MPDIFNADNKISEKEESANQNKQKIHTVFKTEPDTELDTKEQYSPSKQKRRKKHRRHKVDNYSETLKQENPTKNPLKAYAPKPYKTGFDSQMIDEEVVLVLRRHPITQLKKIFIIILLCFLPLLMSVGPLFDFFTFKLRLALTLGWYALLTTYTLESFLVWFFNVFVITDERIIDVDFYSLIYKDVSSAKIENIEDITASTGGFLASLVDFGTIYIQTAGETPQLQFEEVPHPAKITRILNELILEEEREKMEGRVK